MDDTSMCMPDGLPTDKDGNPRKRYVRITYDGSSCVCKPGEAKDIIGDSFEPEKYKTEDVYLSDQEVAAMPEFDGW